MSSQVQFGQALRRWRNKRGRAQLELANLAGYSQRHISFLESGRSQPSRRTVVTLAEALDVPLRDRNSLLQAAGFAPMFSSEPLDSEFLRFALEAFEKVLQSHRPFPAIVVDRAWNMYAGNDNAFGLFQMYLDKPAAISEQTPLNVLRMTLSPDGTRNYIRNWPEYALNVLNHLKRDLDFDPTNTSIGELIREFEADPELCAYKASNERPRLAPFSTIEFERDGQVVELFTLISQFASPNDATLAELRVETFLPANAASRAVLDRIDAEVSARLAIANADANAGPDPKILWLLAEPPVS